MEIFFQDRFYWPTTTRAYVHVAGGHVEQRGANGRVPVPVEATRDPHLRHPGPRQREGRPRGQREGEDFNVERWIDFFNSFKFWIWFSFENSYARKLNYFNSTTALCAEKERLILRECFDKNPDNVRIFWCILHVNIFFKCLRRNRRRPRDICQERSSRWSGFAWRKTEDEWSTGKSSLSSLHSNPSSALLSAHLLPHVKIVVFVCAFINYFLI